MPDKSDGSRTSPQSHGEGPEVAAGGEEQIHGDGYITHEPSGRPRGRYLAVLSLAAMGVVYGDIGTSPIYAMRESFHEQYNITASLTNVFGILSLIFWSLIIVISIKYLTFILRADN